jgi:hypothetical protein
MLSRRLLLKAQTIVPFLARKCTRMSRNISFRTMFPNKPVSIPSELTVNLTPVEDQLCTLLDECRHELARKGKNVECRIAGGWVRDKVSYRMLQYQGLC